MTLGLGALEGAGRALNTFLELSASSSRFNRSSRCVFSFAAIASPGRTKVALVIGLDDLVGTKPGLLVESVDASIAAAVPEDLGSVSQAAQQKSQIPESVK